MSGPHGTEDTDSRPISVAELLARNGTHGAPPVGGRRRRRRGNADAVTVAELTGEIPAYRTGSFPAIRDDTAAASPATEPDPAPRADMPEADVPAADVPVVDTVGEPDPDTVAPEPAGTDTVEAEPTETDTVETEPAIPEAVVSESVVSGSVVSESVAPEAVESGEETAVGPAPDAQPDAAEAMSPDPIDDQLDDHLDADDLSADLDDRESGDRDTGDHDGDGDRGTSTSTATDTATDTATATETAETDRRGPADVFDSTDDRPSYLQTHDHQLFGGREGERPDTAPEPGRPSPMTTALRAGAVIGQSVLAVLLGAGLFLGFSALWSFNSIVALVLAVLVILGLVVAVRVVRKTEDIASTLIAVAVGALVTFGPLVLILSA